MTFPTNFDAKVRATNCLVWIGSTNSKGYGLVNVGGGRIELAHRVAYEAEFGPIPDGLVIDHLCRVRNCVNPMHLEAVTQGENGRRGRNAKRLQTGDVCINGHVITDGDLYVRPNGLTECRACNRLSSRKPDGGRGPRPTAQRTARNVARDLDLVARQTPAPLAVDSTGAGRRGAG